MKVVIAGGGGHARSVIEALRAAGEHEPVALTDPRPELAGTELDGVPVVGDDDQLPGLLEHGVAGACLGLGGNGDNRPRARLFARVSELGFALPAVVHPRATVATRAGLGPGCAVLAAAVVGPGARVGANVIVNSAAVVEHDCALAAHSHTASGCVIGGGVHVAEGAHVGLGAVLRPGVKVGAWALVGAGAVVVRDVPEGVTVVGSPAAALAHSPASRAG